MTRAGARKRAAPAAAVAAPPERAADAAATRNRGAKRRTSAAAADDAAATPAQPDACVKADNSATPAVFDTRKGPPSSASDADAATHAASPSADSEATDGLTAYEREREANIKRNLERMAALNLPVLARDVAPPQPTAAAPVRGLSSRRRKAAGDAEAPPPRKSLRGQGLAPDGTLAAGIDLEKENGDIVLASGGTVLFASPPRATRPEGVLPFVSLNGSADTDAAFLATLRGAPVEAPAPEKTRGTLLARSTLSPSRVAKLCPKGISHLDFQRRSDALIVAAGDKEGNVGLWRADAAVAMEDDDGEDTSFRAFRPHSQYISGLRWTAAGASRVLTCAYDGSLRALDAEAGQWLELFASAEGDEFSAFDCSPDGSACYVGDNQGGVRLLDARAGTAGAPLALHDKRINTVHIDAAGGGAMLATACGDARVCVWDVRMFGGSKARPLASITHGKSCQAAYFAPDGSGRLLATSYDDTLTVWADFQKGTATARTTIKHDNQTGRWVLPFRAVWAPSSDAVVVGSMKRETELVDAHTGRYLARLSSAEHMTAIPSRHAAHTCLPVIAAATASGRVHIWETPA